MCGAYSPPEYQRWGQRFAGKWDHPKIGQIDRNRAMEVNLASLRKIWPVLSLPLNEGRI